MRKKTELEGLKVGEHEVLKCLSVSISDDEYENAYVVLLDNGEKAVLDAASVHQALDNDTGYNPEDDEQNSEDNE